MGEIADFPSTKFRITPPARRLSPRERVNAAYQVIEEAELALRLGNDPNSGRRLLARAAVLSAASIMPPGELQNWLTALADEVTNPPGGGAAA